MGFPAISWKFHHIFPLPTRLPHNRVQKHECVRRKVAVEYIKYNNSRNPSLLPVPHRNITQRETSQGLSFSSISLSLLFKILVRFHNFKISHPQNAFRKVSCF